MLELGKKEVKRETEEEQKRYNTKGEIELGWTVHSIRYDLIRHCNDDGELLELFGKKLKEPSVSILEIINLFLSNHKRLYDINKGNVIESLFSVLIYQMVNGKEKIDEQAVDTIFQLVRDTMNMQDDLELQFENIKWIFTAVTFALAIQKETRENIVLLAGSIGDILETGRCNGFDTKHLDETLKALIFMSENETVKKMSSIIFAMQNTDESVMDAYSKISSEFNKRNLPRQEKNEDRKQEKNRKVNDVINIIREKKNNTSKIDSKEQHDNNRKKIIDNKNKEENLKLRLNSAQIINNQLKENETRTKNKFNLGKDINGEKQNDQQIDEKSNSDIREQFTDFQEQPSQSAPQKTGTIGASFNFMWWAVTKFLSMIKNAFLAMLNQFKPNSNKKPEFSHKQNESQKTSLDNSLKQATKLSKSQEQDEERNKQINNFDK